MELRLVADTNLFFECRRLEDLPWAELGGDPVVILLTRPVLTEIDKHKSSTGRTRDRALDIFGRVRALIKTNATDEVIRESSPCVLLRRAGDIRPSDDLRDELGGYERNDERIVGILATLLKQEGNYQTKLFTHDTGPADTAQGLGLPVLLIDDHWLRPPAETNEGRKIRELESKLSSYAALEPKIVIEHDGGDKIVTTRRINQALTTDEIESLLEVLKAKHPMAINFVPPSDTPASLHKPDITLGYTLEPPDDASIRQYHDEAYPQWLKKCKAILSELHKASDTPDVPVGLTWRLRNEGSRPATRLRVEFTATGPLVLRRLASQNNDDHAEKLEVPPQCPALPKPPKPPPFKRAPIASASNEPRTMTLEALRAASLARGASTDLARLSGAASDIWKRSSALDAQNILGQIGVHNLHNEQRRFAGLTGAAEGFLSTSITPYIPSIDPILTRGLIPPKHNPEDFFYDDWSPDIAVTRGALTCELWRHQGGDELFDMLVVFEKDGATGGTVRCTVHADNLTVPSVRDVVVRREIITVHLLAQANRMIDEL